MKNKFIMQSLPLVAAVLGNKYGVKVEISGDKAFTDGKTINLPGLPLGSDEILTGLARGYIDHESAHIRETDFDAVKKAKLTPLEMNIWNCLEDWRVENKLAELFPGCHQNFNWLVRHLFEKEIDLTNCNPANEILNWLLLSVRAWDISSLGKIRDQTGVLIEKYYPGLLDQLSCVLQKVQASCSSTEECILFAQKIASILKDQINNSKKNDEKDQCKKDFSRQFTTKSEGRDELFTGSKKDILDQCKSVQELKELVASTTDDLPKNIGELLAEDLTNKNANSSHQKIQVAVVGKRMFRKFDHGDLQEVLRSSSALKIRLQGMMQSKLLQRSRIARQGKLATHQLHKISVSDPRVFKKTEEKQGINTAVHILVDCSGSMRKRMELTTKACYALAKALESIKGINLGVTAFPAKPPSINVGGGDDKAAVYPILCHEDRVHSKFHTKASGCTPMGEATWWVLQQMLSLNESRKIILILTDGDPDCLSGMTEAINHGRNLGFEFYGIGIDDTGIGKLLPHHSCTIRNLAELTPAMFKLLQDALIK